MSLCLWWLFSLTLNPRTPTHLTTDSLIGTNPGIDFLLSYSIFVFLNYLCSEFIGLGFRPMPSSEEDVLSSLIYYQGTNDDSFRFWVDGLTQFLNGKILI